MDMIRMKVGMDFSIANLWGSIWVLYKSFIDCQTIEEKRGGLPFRHIQGIELSQFMSLAEVGDARFSGSRYIWCNNRQGILRVWKRLDRLLLNSADMLMENNILVQHLGRDPSDHAPLLISASTRLDDKPRSFRFLNIWTTKPGFIDVIKESWSISSPSSPLQTAEQRVLEAEIDHDNHPSERSLVAVQEARARLKHTLVIEEEFWRQKARVTDESSIYNEAVSFFQELFTNEREQSSNNMLDIIPKLITEQDNEMLIEVPSMQEVKEVISKILSCRLAKVLPHIISPQQSDFVQGRQMADNFLLAQELLNDIKKPNRGGNVMLKLDMMKAYDRVSWLFLIQVLRRFGFSEIWIDMIWRLISNVWFSVIVNGLPHGFFKSSRAVRQDDPISPALFVISAEVLSRSLNALAEHRKFRPFKVPKGCSMVTHLDYADDVIILTSGLKASITLVKEEVD
ncbi:uncharacterized protein [Coffea arabica]|uniref:Reverse transcriptase domain-containing protein n=1 Tax=Coffea arabica TaxID=13443 RepID=A0ABM4W2N5_COFAR